MNTLVTIMLIILVVALFRHVCERIGEQARDAAREGVSSVSGKEAGNG